MSLFATYIYYVAMLHYLKSIRYEHEYSKHLIPGAVEIDK